MHTRDVVGPVLLERARELAELAQAAREAAAGEGGLVLVSGEAGIGKSSLARALRGLLPANGRLLVGHCDDLGTPRTLGPFRDLVGSVGTGMTRALREGGERDAVPAALRAELDWAGHPTVLVVEDVHWADEATLDVLGYLARRIAGLPAVLVLTYRDDELTREHPLQQLLGQASASGRVRRLPLRRLSEQAVRQLSEASPVDAHDVFAMTSGNPFFVTEVLATGDGDRVPSTVADAVLARVRRLDPATQAALDQLATVPSMVERWLVDALVAGGLAALAAAEEHGLLTVSPTSVAFRHELARRAIADSLPVARRVELNRRVLEALAGREDADLSRIVHHAAQAGDADAIVGYGPAAARDAAGAGAHREAVAHYRLVLGHRERFAPAELAELLEGYAVECYTVGATEAPIVESEAVELRRSLGDQHALGMDLRWLSRMQYWAGDRAAAQRSAAEAIAVLEPAGDRRLLALALSNQSQLHMLANRATDCVAVGERAVALAREVGDAAILSHALLNVGSARWQLGDSVAWPLMEESLRVALAAGEVEHACRSCVVLGWHQLDELRLDDAERTLAEGISLAERHDHLGFLGYLTVELGMLKLARAEWDDAVRAARRGLDGAPLVRHGALTVLGRVRVRRGEPGGDELLGEAWALAVELEELQRTGPTAAARAEAAWLAGDHAAVRAVAGPAYDEARRLGHVPLQAQLSYWLTKAGQAVPPGASEHPYALQAAGRWREAAAAWQAAGYPYEHAAALAESPDPQDRLAALAQLDALGAAPLARLVRAGLRRLGIAHVPRGPVGATRQNPAGLTERQVQVLRLLSQGCTNAEIADRLVVSTRTVDSHVAAVLAKLDVATRRAAAARARDLGVLDLEAR
jgi:DNA-binding CsgD family transcriptional regulator/tetratricopeptide (TPR) repeat protein/energy-coupling factor transporter ATP-binding protein EcfA2